MQSCSGGVYSYKSKQHIHSINILKCLATDACLTASPGVVGSIPVQSHTFVELNHEIIPTVNLLPSADPFKKTSKTFCNCLENENT